jgi:ribosomal protein S18 acetylase RimI-like enzyme
MDAGTRLRRGGIPDVREAVRVGIASRRAARRGLYADPYLDGFDADDEATQLTRLLADESRRSRLWVAEQSGRVVAFALTTIWPEDPTHRSAYLDSLYVDPSMFRRGIGSRLLAFTESHLAEAGFHTAFLWSVAEATDAAAFYAATGWRRTGRTKQLNLDRPRTAELWTKSVRADSA